MHVLKISNDKFMKMWKNIKGNLRLDPVEKYPWETHDSPEYLERCRKAWNPDPPPFIYYYTSRGQITIKNTGK